jgi:FKBP-type peptidyl-prolyl cis-trans isomerase SlyD
VLESIANVAGAGGELNRRTTVEQDLVVSKDVVVRLAYTLRVDEQVVESAEGEEPVEFLQGHGQILPALERALYGMAGGEQKRVFVGPEDAYGDIDPEAIATLPRGEFPPSLPLQVGMELSLEDEQGQELEARVLAVDEKSVRVDFNHPLAGKELVFDVTVMALRRASPEELSHGHVHGEQHT